MVEDKDENSILSDDIKSDSDNGEMALVYIDNARKQIEQAKSVQEVKVIRDKAITLQELAKRQKLSLEVQNELARIRLYAERKGGQLIKEGQDAGEIQDKGKPKKLPEGTLSIPTLSDLGISKKQSMNWQRIARIPEEKFTQKITEITNKALEKEEELTTATFIRFARKIELMDEIKEKIPLPEGVFDIIYSDPPWRYEHPISFNRAIEQKYPTMSIEDIKLLDIPSAEDAILFLWSPAPMIKHALGVMEEWEFTYRTHAIWDKEIIGPGYWFRGQHELLLVGIKGKFHPPPPSKRISSVYREKRGEHSKKPEYYYNLIEQYYPDGRYLELFARENKRKNWTTWGNEIKIAEESDELKEGDYKLIESEKNDE